VSTGEVHASESLLTHGQIEFDGSRLAGVPPWECSRHEEAGRGETHRVKASAGKSAGAVPLPI
jgi:hypothetical protein